MEAFRSKLDVYDLFLQSSQEYSNVNKQLISFGRSLVNEASSHLTMLSHVSASTLDFVKYPKRNWEGVFI